MKKVLIVTPSFNHGGTNRSLWNFLNTKQSDDFTVSVFAMDHRGPYKEKFEKFNLLPQNSALTALFSLDKVKGAEKLKRSFWKVIFKFVFKGNKQKLLKYAAQKLNKQDFDVVVSFQEGTATEFASFVPAKKRVGWVRCDYSNYLRLAKKNTEKEIYAKFDNIVCVSKYTAGVFAGFYPEFGDKILSIYNIIDTAGIINTSKDAFDSTKFETNDFTLVSVGRMDVVKRFSYIPEIAKKMKQNGCKFKWFIIGSGGAEEERVKGKIAEYEVNDLVVLLGSKNNPYPYIANSDVLVCPSSTEACPNVVNEAKILHVPVVAADFGSASEYVIHGENGLISTIDNMAETLIELYNNSDLYNKLKANISNFEYKNDEIRNQLENLLID